uniref:INTS8 TPR repeats domain-containing protein n=1 Tax=Bursaphelenchus xylophilus TaxID=6326 RepID=A0A1I7S763_BURXY
MLMLNFLKIPPEQNWYDFLVDRSRLSRYLQDPNTDARKLITLCDQFIDQALATYNEIKHAKRRRFESEDIQRTEKKREDLWRCAWACFAAFGWDLEGLLEVSTVSKVYNMFCRFFETFFRVKIEKDLISSLSKVMGALDSNNAFFVWMCLRLVLLVDIRSRVPKPPVKQTVSNPNNQPDPALIEASKINSFTRNVRKSMADVVKLMETICNMKISETRIPMPGAFAVEKLNVKKPIDLNLDSKTLSFDIVRTRIQCDLLFAHFKAVHIKSSIVYYNKIRDLSRINAMNNIPDKCFHKTFVVNTDELKAIGKVLAKAKSQANNSKEFNVTKGINRKITFGDMVDRLRKEEVVVPSPLPQPIMPSQISLSRFVTCGPVLWDLINSINYNDLLGLSEQFSAIYEKEFKSPKNIAMSPILCELLERTPFNYNVSIFLFMQLEYIVSNVDIVTWMSSMNIFTTAVDRAQHRLKDFLYNLCFEVFRIRMSIWDTLFGRPWNGLSLKLFTTGLNTMVTNSILNHEVVPTIDWGIGKIASIYCTFLLNMNMSNVIMVVPNILRNTPPQANFVRIISTVIANESMSGLAWKFLHSVLLNDNVRDPASAMSKNEFWDVTCKLRHEKVIKHILTYLLAFYNKIVVRLERQRLPYADIRLRNSWAFVDKTIRDNKRRPVPEEYNMEQVDCTYLLGVIKRLLDNAIFSAPKDPYLRRQLGDVHYAVREYDKAMLQYAEVFLLFQNKMTSRHRRESVNDAMISKMTHCFYTKKMFVMACLSGQMRRDLARHFIFLPQIASEVNKTHDAGAVYFKFLYDTKLFESLTAHFEKLGYLHYLSQMIRLTPTRSANRANMKQIKLHEIRKRKKRFLDIIIKTVQNTCQ